MEQKREPMDKEGARGTGADGDSLDLMMMGDVEKEAAKTMDLEGQEANALNANGAGDGEMRMEESDSTALEAQNELEEEGVEGVNESRESATREEPVDPKRSEESRKARNELEEEGVEGVKESRESATSRAKLGGGLDQMKRTEDEGQEETRASGGEGDVQKDPVEPESSEEKRKNQQPPKSKRSRRIFSDESIAPPPPRRAPRDSDDVFDEEQVEGRVPLAAGVEQSGGSVATPGTHEAVTPLRAREPLVMAPISMDQGDKDNGAKSDGGSSGSEDDLHISMTVNTRRMQRYYEKLTPEGKKEFQKALPYLKFNKETRGGPRTVQTPLHRPELDWDDNLLNESMELVEIGAPANRRQMIAGTRIIRPQSSQEHPLVAQVSRRSDVLEKVFENEALVFGPNFQNSAVDLSRHFTYIDLDGFKKRNDFDPNKELFVKRVEFSPDIDTMIRHFARDHISIPAGRRGGCGSFTAIVSKHLGIGRYTSLSALKAVFDESEDDTDPVEVMDGLAQLCLAAIHNDSPWKIRKLSEDVTSVSLSHEQCAGLLAKMLFKKGPKSLYRLFNGKRKEAKEKVKFLLSYFRTMADTNPKGTVTYAIVKSMKKRHYKTLFDSKSDDDFLTQLALSDSLKIEETSYCTHIIITKDNIGFGALGSEASPDDITFLTSPELLIGSLLIDKLSDDESIVVTGALTFSGFRNTGQQLEWRPLTRNNSIAIQQSKRDTSNRVLRQHILVTPWKPSNGQYDDNKMRALTAALTANDGDFSKVPFVIYMYCQEEMVKFVHFAIVSQLTNRPLIVCSKHMNSGKELLDDSYFGVYGKSLTVGQAKDLLQNHIRSHRDFPDILEYFEEEDSSDGSVEL